MSSDYEGVITLWDTHSLQPVTEYEAHNKRVWSVDFCPSNAQLLASGSDDGRVKVGGHAWLRRLDRRVCICDSHHT